MKMLLLFGLSVCTLFSCSSTKVAGSTPVTEQEAAQAIRQALEQGVTKGITTLNKQDGFFNNPSYKILLPPEAGKIETTFRKMGMGPLVDRAVLAINHAAEDAVSSARPIFVTAITEMSVTDAMNIIRGPSDAATQYFRNKTFDKLTPAFLPIIKSSLDKFSATKYYADVINAYNGFPTTINKINPDLPSYVASKTIDALFDQIAKEEQSIRTDRKERTTDALRKVFGGR